MTDFSARLASRFLARGSRSALTTLLIPLAGLASAVGCGDGDSTTPVPATGGSSGKGGTGGKGGASGKGGTTGEAGEGGTGGKGGSSGGKGGSSGNGGSSGTGTGGGSGEGAAGGEDATGGTSGNGGTAGSTAGVAGTAGAGEGGEGGEMSPPDPVYGAISKTSEFLLSTVNDLRGVTFASSGKIYLTGHVGINSGDNVTTGVDRELAIVRLNADATIDDTFGTNGVVRHNLRPRVVEDPGGGAALIVRNNGNEESYGIRELSTGEFIIQVNMRDVAGTGQDVALVKVDAAGALVTGFGTDGVKRVDFGWVEGVGTFPTSGQTPSDTSWGIGLDKSTPNVEKIVVFGFGPARRVTTGTQRVDNDRYVTRVLASDGNFDTSFNGGATFTFNSASTLGDNARRGVVYPDGSMVSAGYTNLGEGLGNHVILLRLLPNGTLDPNFRYGDGIPGIIGFSPLGVSRFNPFLPDGGLAECYAVGKQSTGHFVTTGYGRATAAGVPSSLGYAITDNVDLVSFRTTPSGAVDVENYGTEGTLAIQSEEFHAGVDTEDRGRDLIVLPDDRVVHVGKYGPYPSIFVVKPNGVLDAGSDGDGRFEYDPLVRAADPTANPPVTALTTSQFFAVGLSTNGKNIIAATNNHELGVKIVFLTVADP